MDDALTHGGGGGAGEDDEGDDGRGMIRLPLMQERKSKTKTKKNSALVDSDGLWFASRHSSCFVSPIKSLTIPHCCLFLSASFYSTFIPSLSLHLSLSMPNLPEEMGVGDQDHALQAESIPIY